MRLRKRKGQALVEMALTLPLLLMLLLGIIDFGWLFNHQLILTNASREGARQGTLGVEDEGVRDAVLTYLENSEYYPMPDPENIVVDQSNGATQVSITSSVPVLFGTVGPQFDLQAQTQMRRE